MKRKSDNRIVLVVDDKPANIQVARNILKDAYTVRMNKCPRALDLARALPNLT